jgi:tetratricopeptide (TPR) repeat protein
VKFIVHEKDREYEFLLTDGVYIVGRDPTCDLTLDSRRISRRHMSCSVKGDEVKVKDLGSRNGIIVAGARVREAALQDGDVVEIGDIILEFRKPAAGTTPAGQAAQPKQTQEPVEPEVVEAHVEDKESTPPDGALVPASAAVPAPALVQKDGRWFVTDPATGRQIEIVPAQPVAPAAGPQRKSLLSTTKGKLLIGGLAAAVALILLAALLQTAPEPPPPPMSGAEYNRLVEAALAALDRDDAEQAIRNAYAAYEGRPKDPTAKTVGKLAKIWPAWREDFWAHWKEVEGLLEDLYELDSTPAVQKFARSHRDFIEKERVYSQYAVEAEHDYKNGDYENAWKKLLTIPESSTVRKRDAQLFENIKKDFKRHIENQMKSAAARQDWTEAKRWADKLRDYYPDIEAQAEETVARYAQYEAQSALMQKAKQAMASASFAEAERILQTIPADSPYSSEAQRLIQQAKADARYARALALYNQGAGQDALKELQDQNASAAGALRRHVETVLELYDNARKAQRNLELIDAEQYWQRLAEMETDPNNSYRKEALRQLGLMKDARLEYARQLVEGGDKARKNGQFEKARELYEKATVMDPDARMGIESVARMEEQGRMDYRKALIEADRNPKAALELLDRAIRQLPPDDKYYTWAVDKKREIEQKLKNP